MKAPKFVKRATLPLTIAPSSSLEKTSLRAAAAFSQQLHDVKG